MKKTVYQENIEDGIKRQLRWQMIDNQEDRDAFLDYIISYCQKMKSKPFKQAKSSKTKHG